MRPAERAGRRLARAIQGKGAFRRFKDQLHEEHPGLLPTWYAFRDARATRRAVQWLADNELIDDQDADRFLAGHPDPDLPLQVTYPADLAGPADSDISTVEGMFNELFRRGGDPVREVEAALRAMGYVPAVPERGGGKPREVYLGWADPARDYTRGKFTLSLDSRTVWFRPEDDQRGIRDMPGAYTTGSYVAFRISAPGGVAHAMAAARKVKR